MRSILIVTSTYPRWTGDTEPPFVQNLAYELSKEFRVTVLAPHCQGAKRLEVEGGVTVKRFRYCFAPFELLTYQGGILENLNNRRWTILLVPLYFLSLFVSIARLTWRREFSIIHAHWIIPQGLVAVLVRKLLRLTVPVAVTSHGGDLYALNTPLYRRLKKLVLENVERVTVVSKPMKKVCIELGAREERISVISMGVDTKQLFSSDKSYPRKSKRVLFVGRLVEKKGVEYGLEAVSKLSKKHPEMQFTIVGDGPRRPQLERMARNLGIETKVEFVGSRRHDQLPEYYLSSEILLLPSIIAESGDQEGLGLTAVEAMACECTVIASDLPATREFIQDGVSGYLVRPKASGVLVKLMDRLFGDVELIQRIGQTARRSVVDKYSWTTKGEQYRRMLREITG